MSDIFILAPDPNGECCDCSDRMSVCDACNQNHLFVPIFQYGPSFDCFYPDLATAQAVLDDPNWVASCIGFNNLGSSPVGISSDFAATNNTPNVLLMTITFNLPGFASTNLGCGLSLLAGSILTITWSGLDDLSGNTAQSTLSLGEAICGSTGGTTLNWSGGTGHPYLFSFLIPTTGNYTLVVATTDIYNSTTTILYTISCNDTMTVNPIVALYNNLSDPFNPNQLDCTP